MKTAIERLEAQLALAQDALDRVDELAEDVARGIYDMDELPTLLDGVTSAARQSIRGVR